MSEIHLAEVLREAVERSGDGWQTQPSILRRRLEAVLGRDGPAHRAQVHLLIVAAEERVPIGLGRAGADEGRRRELSSALASTRGWTADAAEWAVDTWAVALGLAPPDLVPGPVVVPESVAEVDSERTLVAPEGPTLLPASVVATPELPPPVAAPASPDRSPLPADPSGAKGDPKLVAKMEAFLHAEVDAGFAAWSGDPRIVVGVVVGIAVATAFFLVGLELASKGLLYVSGAFIVAGVGALPIARRRIPVWWVAVRGTQVTLIGTVRNASNTPIPTRVCVEGPLADVTVVPGSDSSVQIGPEQVTFLRRKAKAMAALSVGCAT